MTNAQYYFFGVGCLRHIEISHLKNELIIVPLRHEFSNSLTLIAIITKVIFCGTDIAQCATKYYVAVDLTRDGEFDLS
jgi:hypothetical protein